MGYKFIFYALFACAHCFFSVRAYISPHFQAILLENYFFFFLCFGFYVSILFVFSFYFFVLYFAFNILLNNITLNNILQFPSHFIQMSCKNINMCLAIYKENIYSVHLSRKI